MAALNLSTNGPSIAKSYQSVISSVAPSGPAANSPTYGQWALYSVSAPLVNAFQQDSGGKESVLKVQSTGEGELLDLIEEFSDGRVMFAFAKVKDPNTSLPKYALIGWCGEGVPERTKGYFTSHLAAVEKVLHGYHVQITARSDRDITPESITKKISDASGSKYSASNAASNADPAPPIAARKPVFMPTQSSGGSSAFNPLLSSRRATTPHETNVDKDGWGEDAPQIMRTQLEKVKPAYQPTKVNMRELSSQKDDSKVFSNQQEQERDDVIKGAYQPVGKVDIASLRKQAQSSGSASDDRPTVVKGAYEPVGKVDIAAIKARAQQTPENRSNVTGPPAPRQEDRSSIPDRSIEHSAAERLTSMPKPKVANRFGSNAASFKGTTAPNPGNLGKGGSIGAPKLPAGASRTFADEGGKTPAQLWAEKKARQQGGAADGNPQASSLGSDVVDSSNSTQISEGGGWKSGYTGKSWAAVQTTQTGQSATSNEQESSGYQEDAGEPAAPASGGVGAILDKFKGTPPIGGSITAAERSTPNPPPLYTSNKPNPSGGIPISGLPARSAQPEEDISRPNTPTSRLNPRSPTPEDEASGSPIRVAMPVARSQALEVADAHEEQFSPPTAIPVSSIIKEASLHEISASEELEFHNAARAAASNVAEISFEPEGQSSGSAAGAGGKRALIQYDYEKAEDNELELREGEYVENIEMVDEDWWMGQNAQGETGLFPSNYVELVESDPAAASAPTAPAGPEPQMAVTVGKTATALYDYEAAEGNELSFPEGAKIENVEFPDDDWWSGEYGGYVGLFPANYVELTQ